MGLMLLLMLGATAGVFATVVVRESSGATVPGLARLRAALGLTTMADLQRQAAAEVLRRALTSVSVRYLPNDVLVMLHPDDHAKVGDLAREFCRGVRTLLMASVRNGPEDGGLPYELVGELDVRMKAEPRVRRGTVGIGASVSRDTELVDTAAGAGLLDLCRGDRRFPLPMQGEVTIGRGEEAAIRFDEADVSREHAVLECSGMRVVLRDAGGSNGTRVNGRQVRRADLSVGDRIELGGVAATLDLSASTSALVGRDTDPIPG